MPPLNTLRPFESTARLFIFIRAPKGLHVAPATGSRQIKALEGYFGVAALTRRCN